MIRKSILLSICITLLASFSFAEDKAEVKITKEPALGTRPAMTCATAFVKASTLAPDSNGWGEKDYEGVYTAMGMSGMTKLMTWMGQKSATPTGSSFAMWYENPDSTKPQDLTSKWCMPIAGNPDPTADVMIESFPEMQVITCTYMGHYSTAMTAWNATMKYAEDNGWMISSPPMEVYLKGPGDTQNSAEWVTEIVLPVMKKETKSE